MSEIPADHLDLLERPIFAQLGTIRPDGYVQVNPMWFEYDGQNIRFTHTTTRSKFRNLKANPTMTLAITDPTDPMRYIELRGHLTEVIADPSSSFYQELGRRYGNESTAAPPDKAERVILVMTIDAVGRVR
ncbi:PPOX class F420-dependent oxidoreductase [Homoserinimonas sp. OAct 916]|uniref:PPOX class F420-dependent oxidoreductase n=1 Tax=Homoserinimonas sp. OAct 916 TaxID=2211450 RepID=UPI000DBEA71A|nr:PPOX class F420-dependent oxidoreductase [Homoserinimonas sp. OAct 916]